MKTLADLIPMATAEDTKRLLKLMRKQEHAKAIKENNLRTKNKENENNRN